MPTIKSRINISVSDDVRRALSKLARRDRMPEATKAARLIETAIEVDEDAAWDRLANERDRKGGRFVSHKKTWG